MTSVLLLLSSAVANAACCGYLKFAEPLAIYLLNVSALQENNTLALINNTQALIYASKKRRCMYISKGIRTQSTWIFEL